MWWVLSLQLRERWEVAGRHCSVLLTVWITHYPTQDMQETNLAFGVQNPKLGGCKAQRNGQRVIS